MKLTSSFIFLMVLITSGFCYDTTTANPTETTPTTVETTTETTLSTTTEQPDTTTTTIVSTTSTNPPTTSTLPPTTSAKPTTTPLPDTTTSSKPTTVPPVTTTTSPPQPPAPVEGSWNVTEGNLTCIRADLKIRFKIPVGGHDSYIILSPNATSSGNCRLSETLQKLELEDSEYSLTMIFEKDSNNAYLKNVTFRYSLPVKSDTVSNNTKLFSAKLGNSYMCDSTDNVNLENVTMEVFRIRIQSFGSIGNKDFGTAEECEADNQVNNMVPIAVGIALLVLVVVVLIAYFVGRRRSRQRGYQSV